MIARTRRTAEEAAIDAQLKKEREEQDLYAFLPAYERATGLTLSVEEITEAPDFIMRRSDGLIIGVELTMIREQGPPDTALFREISTGTRMRDVDDAIADMWSMIEQKSNKVRRYKTERSILVLQNIEAAFNQMTARALEIPSADFFGLGFNEIWLADFTELRAGRHQEIELLGLYPLEYRRLFSRSDHDQKPYR